MHIYDFIAIGGGSAGLTAAAQVKSAGAKVAVVDHGAIGGLCSLNGCNPKKVLVRSAEVWDEVRRAADFGVALDAERLDWSRVVDRKETLIKGVTQGSEESLATQDIDLVRGAPRFISPTRLQVNDEIYEAAGILIATGSHPRRLEFPGSEVVHTSNDLLGLRRIPQTLVTIGAGAVAFELGQVFARAGSQVIITTPNSQALPMLDREIADAVIEFSRSVGIRVLTNARVRAVQRTDNQSTIELDVEGKATVINSDYVLNAAGRPASVDGLDLPRGNVQADKRGIIVTEFLRSPSNSHVFAAGDAHGRLQLSPIASYEGRIAGRNFLEGDVERVNYDSVPRAVFTIPPVAMVGLTEAEARKRGLNVTAVVRDMAEWKVYGIAGEVKAKAKVILEYGSGRIVGAHVFGAGAAEMIHVFAMAIRFGIPADELKRMVYVYPTFSSVLPYLLA